MEFNEAKHTFISTWGSLGTLWGINKAMAQIQALLFITPEPLTTEQIMEELQISRGNTSMNVRQLIDWGIVTKRLIAGERKEYYTTEKDVQELARIIAKERSRRELKPVIKTLDEISTLKLGDSQGEKEFLKQTKALHEMAQMVDTLFNKVADQKQNWVNKTLLKLFS